MIKLVEYMKCRAKFEKAKWELTEDDLFVYFRQGVRNFFGVVVDDNGELVEDQEQPSFFNSYKSFSSN